MEETIDNKKYRIIINKCVQFTIYAVTSAGSIRNNRFVLVILEYKS